MYSSLWFFTWPHVNIVVIVSKDRDSGMPDKVIILILVRLRSEVHSYCLARLLDAYLLVWLFSMSGERTNFCCVFLLCIFCTFHQSGRPKLDSMCYIWKVLENPHVFDDDRDNDILLGGQSEMKECFWGLLGGILWVYRVECWGED